MQLASLDHANDVGAGTVPPTTKLPDRIGGHGMCITVVCGPTPIARPSPKNINAMSQRGISFLPDRIGHLKIVLGG